MKNLYLKVFICITACQIQAQKVVNFNGQIINYNPSESIYLVFDESISTLNILEDGTFSLNVNMQQIPSYFYFANISKRGKIEQQTPRIWFENDSLEININWLDKSFQTKDLSPYQSLSEQIENLKDKQKIAFILDHSSSFPSLYFANRLKGKISISDLKQISKSVNENYKNSIYLKKIDNYIEAKSLEKLKKGKKVEEFELPDAHGNKVLVIKKNGNKKLIAILSSGCYYSVSSISLLEQLNELNNGNIELITIWSDKSKDTWQNAHHDQKSKISWTDLWDENEFASTYFNQTIFPTFYVINEEGVLTKKIRGYSKKTAKKLKALLN
jgi:peroxiredoxin